MLRGNPNHPGQFEAERFYAEALHQGTRVPVPWPYRIDASTDIFGWSYAIMPRMPGVPPSDAGEESSDAGDESDPSARIAMARALGANLAEMHELTWAHPGRYYPATGTVGPLEPPDASVWALPAPVPLHAATRPYDRWVAERIRARLTTARRHNPSATTEADLAWTERRLAERASALAVPFQPRLVMEDYKEGNLVVRRDAGEWAVSGVFDLAQSYFGDAESDLARTLCSYLDEDADPAREFLRSYLAARPPRPGFAERAVAYVLLDRALLWEFFQRRGLRWWPESWTFQTWADRYLSLLAPVLAACCERAVRPQE